MNSSRSVNPRPSFAPRALSLAIALLLGAPAFAANSGEAPKNFGLDVKITGESENDRDLGTAPGGTLNDIGIDLRPWAFGQWGDWSAYFMGQAVAATDTIETDTLQSDTDDGNNSRNDGREPDKSYLAAREFWVDYAGLTAYPGEHLRFGRQRLREDSGQWQDTNIEALNWSFETTLLNAHAGVAQRFSEYRTDLDELAPEDKDRTHVFGDISTQWAPHHRIGVRIHHADDSGHLRRPGEEVDNLDKTYTPLRRSLPRRTEQPPGSHPVRLLATARGLRREPGLPQVLARRRRLRHRHQRHQRRPATGREGHRPGTRPGGDQVLQARPAAGLDEPVRRRALGADPLPRRPVQAGRRLRAGHRLDHAPRLRRLHLALLSPARKPDMPDISLSIPRRRLPRLRPLAAAVLGAVLLHGQAWAAQPVEKPQPVPAQAGNEPGLTQGLKETGNYTVTTAPAEPLHLDPPKLPDLSGYTAAAVEAKIVRKPGGRASVQRMVQQQPLKEFTGGSNRLAEWVKRQRQMPQAIFIEGGYVNLAQLAGKLPASALEQVEPGVFVARLPIVVSQGATLDIDKQVKELRLSQERGAFLVNDGMLFVRDSKVTGWSESKKEPAWFKTPNEFRPFLISWGGAEVYLSNSTFTSFGYNASKAYGISISQYSPGMDKQMKRPRPKGWVIDSTIVDSWYGFYCYEADDLVVKGNTYRDNIVYGIDPHDRSHRLIIADNTVHGTRKKHGIIVSREVNDSFIFNNRSYENKLSGIVLDRNSEGNLVAYNEVYRNHSDGITLYESGDNLLWGNQVLANRRHGIRVRNSVNIRLYENLAAGNQLIGVYGHIKDLTNTDRNIALDPFDTKVSLIVVGGKLAGNGSGPLSVDSPLSLELYRVAMLAPTKSSGISLPGVLGEKQDQILDLLVRQDKAVLIDPVESQAELQD